MPRKKTYEEFIREMNDANPYIEVVGGYINTNTKTTVKCVICGHVWSATPHNLLSGTGCPSCAGNKKKNHTLFVEEMKCVNPTIKIAGEYVSASTKVKCVCLICGNKWGSTPNHLLDGKGCPQCAKNKRANILKKENDAFIYEIKIVNPNIRIVGSYVNNKTKIKCRCNICNHEWSAIPSNLLRGTGCPFCASNKRAYDRRKTTKEFIDKMKFVNCNVRVVGEYVKNDIKIDCNCLICGNTWSATPHHLLNGRGCPRCASPKGERRIESFLKSNNIYYVAQKKFDDLVGVYGGKLSYDFYLPYYNMLIEFNGLQHEKPIEYFGGKDKFEIQIHHDNMKRNYAKANCIDLVEIWYYDYDNTEQILKEKIHINNE